MAAAVGGGEPRGERLPVPADPLIHPIKKGKTMKANTAVGTVETLEGMITARLGRQVGLNADWACTAWHVSGNLFLTDQENGTWVLVRRVDLGNGGDVDDQHVETWLESGLRSVIEAGLDLRSYLSGVDAV